MASGEALASSPAAWEALFRKAGEACVKASELKQAKVAGRPVDFQGSVLVIVDGRWPQPHMKDAPARFACLYGKKTGKAETRELPSQD
jgi:hypothetical protein